MGEPKRNHLFVSPAFLVTAIVGLFIGLIVIVVIPNFIGDNRISPANACINNLRQIDGAKNEWALEHNAKTNDIVTINQLTNYLYHGIMLKCPSGGIYTIGKVGENPTCSLSNAVPPHVMP
jgi:hypothetical protein